MSTNHPDNPESTIRGRVLKYHSNFYYVEADGVLYECALRALIKKEGNEVLVGDFVLLDSVNPGSRTARVSQIIDRQNAITRPKMANADQALVVYSLKQPDFDPNQADRYLTHIEMAGLTPILCISKADLAENKADLETICSLYADQLGYTVLFTSVHTQSGLQDVREAVKNHITVLAGPSGSGKSSLLNALNNDLQLRVGEISEKIGRGQHTTRHVELLALDSNEPDTLIADTPGFSNLKFNTIRPAQLERIYRDFAEYRTHCAFSDCLHTDEADCAIREHLSDIAPSRYQSYLDMLTESRQYEEASNASSQKEQFGYKQLDRKGKESLRILRLQEKNRDLSRRKMKQQVGKLDLQDNPDDDDDLESDDFPV